MNDFNFNDMSDEEFRREFVRLLKMYQSGMGGFMRQLYDNEPTRRTNNNISDDDIFRKFFKDTPEDMNNMNTDRGIDEDGSNWESKNWTSPDGMSNFRSYRSSFSGDDTVHPFQPKINTMDILEGKLNVAVMEERYEDAKDIHELMEKLTKNKDENN